MLADNFNSQLLVLKVNQALAKENVMTRLSRVIAVRPFYVLAKSRRGATLVVPCGVGLAGDYNTLFVRSVLRVEKTGWTLSPNGQEGKNLRTLAFWGETNPPTIPYGELK